MISNGVTLKIDIMSFWHAGTGRNAGHYVDAVAHTDRFGLPCLPGRTLKGVVRDAVWHLEQWGHVNPGTSVTLFGSESEGQSALETVPGLLMFSDAELPADVRAYLALDSNAELRRRLFSELFATKIDHSSGTAADQSLRGIEVVVPLCLSATVEARNGAADWRGTLTRALPLIRAVGAHRTRGLGRVAITLQEAA